MTDTPIAQTSVTKLQQGRLRRDARGWRRRASRARSCRRAGAASSSSRTAARTAPVPRPWTTRTSCQAGERRVVDEGAHRLARLLGAHAAHVELVGDVAGAAATTRTAGSASLGRARDADGRSRASGTRRRGPPGADDLGLSPSIAAIVPRTPERRVPRPDRPRRAARAAAAARAARAARARPGARARRPRRGAGRGRARRLGRRRPPLALAAPGGADLLAQRVELGARLREVALRLARAPARAPPRPTRARARPRPLELAPPARAPARRAPRRSRSAAARARPRPLGRLRLGEQRRRCAAAPARPAPRASATTRRVEPEPLRDPQRVRAARAGRARPRRAARGLEVERGRRVGDAVGRARPLLQLGVVRRHDGQPRLAREPREQRLGERRALDGIGAGGELVEQHERPLRSPRRGSRRSLRRCAEKVERLISIDCSSPIVGEHVVEDRQRRLRGGRPQPRLVQQRGDPERLQRDRLAAGVRAADDERAQAAEVEVDRHRRRAGRAAGGARRAAARRRRPRPARRASARESAAAREREVERAGRLDQRLELRGPLADAAPTARAGSARPPRARRSRPRPGGCSARRPRTARRTASAPSSRRRGRRPGTLRARRRLHREHRPAPALGHERLLQVLAHAARAATRAARRAIALPARCAARRAAAAAPARRRRAGRSRPPRRSARSRRRAGRGRVDRREDRASSGASSSASPARAARRARPRPPSRRRAGRAGASVPPRPRGRRAHARPRSRRATAPRRRRAARSPRRSAPGGAARPRRGRARGRARARAPRRARVSVAPARRSTIAGNSSTASAWASTPAGYAVSL